jgi:hypothetical protein
VDSNTEYTLGEDDFTGYTEGNWTCRDADAGTFDAGTVTLDEGEEVTCTIINDDDAAKLILVKDIVNDNGGDAVVSDFNIVTSADTLVWDAGTTTDDTTTYTAETLDVDSNTEYTLGEDDFTGYTEGNWTCRDADAGTFDAGTVTQRRRGANANSGQGSDQRQRW